MGEQEGSRWEAAWWAGAARGGGEGDGAGWLGSRAYCAPGLLASESPGPHAKCRIPGPTPDHLSQTAFDLIGSSGAFLVHCSLGSAGLRSRGPPGQLRVSFSVGQEQRGDG